MAFAPIHVKPLLFEENTSPYPITGRRESELIVIENELKCNYKCSDCNLSVRRNNLDCNLNEDDFSNFNYENLSRRLIGYIPHKALVYFRGVGEPLLPKGQDVIKDLLTNRSDLEGHVQTNGSIPIKDSLIGLIEEGRLNVSVSIDEFHIRGATKYNLRIQKEYCSGVSTSLGLNEKPKLEIIESFPNIRIIDVGPLFSNDLRYLKSNAETVINASSFLAKNLQSFVYTEGKIRSPKLFNKGKIIDPDMEINFHYDIYSRKIQEGLLETDSRDWSKYSDGFYVYMGPELLADRVMIDGRVIPKENPFIALESTYELDRLELPKIEDRFEKFIL